MCGGDIHCMLLIFRTVPIVGVLHEAFHKDLDILNEAMGLTANSVAALAGYAVVCLSAAVCVVRGSDLARTHTFAASAGTTALFAVVVYLQGGLQVKSVVRPETIHFLAQNATPMLMVCIASVLIVLTAESRTDPDIASQRPRVDRSRLFAVLLHCASGLLAVVSLAETVVSVLVMFAPAAGNAALLAFTGERLDVAVAINTPRCTASVLCGMVVLQVAAAMGFARMRSLLLVPSAMFHVADWFAWLVAVGGLAPNAAIDAVTGLGGGATAVVLVALALYAVEDRQQAQAAVAREAQRMLELPLLPVAVERGNVDAESSSESLVSSTKASMSSDLDRNSDSDSSLDVVPARQRHWRASD